MRHKLPTWVAACLTAVLGISGCDTVDQPFKNAINVDWASVVYGDTVRQTESTVYIEDFTGHTCKNCPKATKVLVKLDSLYGDRVVPLAIHARSSGFSNADTSYPTDFSTPESESLWNYFGPPIGLPNGMVQRTTPPTSGSPTPRGKHVPWIFWRKLLRRSLKSSPVGMPTVVKPCFSTA